MKFAFCLFALALLCLFSGIVGCLWVPSNMSGTVLGSGFWTAIGLVCLGGLSAVYQEVEK